MANVKPGWDFSGWPTRFDVKCTDGRTIKENAFNHCDGAKVPIVWNHKHEANMNVLGHMILEKRPSGMYGYGYLNNTEAGESAREQIRHGDINALSICAGHVKQRGGDVLYGDIKEVSLVLTGANKGAYIDCVPDRETLRHSDTGEEFDNGEAYIFNFEPEIQINHSDDEGGGDNEEEREDHMEYTFNHADSVDLEDLANSLTADQKEIVLQILSESLGLSLQHADDGYGELRAIINRLSKDERNALLYILMKDESFEHADKEYSAEELLGTLATLNEDQLNAVYALLGEIAIGSDSIQHADESLSDYYGGINITNNAILSTLTPKQKDYVRAFICIAQDFQDELMHDDDVINAYYGYDSDEIVQSDDYEGDDYMNYNAFENPGDDVVITHEDLDLMCADGARFGSLKESFIAHADEYGIGNIDYLFPDAELIEDKPTFIKRDTEWVTAVLDGAHHTKMSRVKSIYANITEDEARAKGYLKGNKKKEEFFTLLRRTSQPTTVYKKQKFDKDDITDITKFDVIAWVWQEMLIMLKEELGRAILVGDGRSAASEDKIAENCIRPIWNDDDLFTIKKTINKDTKEKMASTFIKEAVRARKDYKGAGHPTLFTTEEWLTEFLLLEDFNGRRIYKSEDEVATAMRVNKIVTVPIMENQTVVRDGSIHELIGIIVNMTDYIVGIDKGGEIGKFSDFDIDYNQYKYLIETRMAGALVTPYSAIVIEAIPASEETPADDDGAVNP